MLFDNSPSVFESEKERNLYYKIFSGYLLNELIPGYAKRLEDFCTLVNNSKIRGATALGPTLKLNPVSTHVSFDNHIRLFSDTIDRGEFADILIHDELNKSIVTIEAKLHSDWSYDKDIESNRKRLRYLRDNLPTTSIFSVLLVTQFRWENAKKLENHGGSNYRLFILDDDCPFVVLFWEQLLEIINEPSVSDFLKSQIARMSRGLMYEFKNEWFIQKK